jgi:cell division protein FtsI (penicillin-binding protein 3)
MAKASARIVAIEFAFGLGILAVLTRAAQLQVVETERWQREASRQRTERVVLPARRGALYDRNGVPLAITQEFYHVGVAPNELEDIRSAFVLLVRNLGVPASALDREFQARKRWIYLHGPFNATQVQPLRDVRGIHLEGEFQRFYPSRDLARPIIGSLSPDRPFGGAGLEAALDSLLTGRPGEAVLLKDLQGRRYDSPNRRTSDPVPGNDVTLTLDSELQEIAERGLDDAIAQMRAQGGDVVFLEPNTGELLALASRKAATGGAPSASVFTDPFEPGSTAKLFTAAALLMRNRVQPSDAVSGENGRWLMPVTSSGRTREVKDDHPVKGAVTLARAIQVSSNVAMAKFSLRLRPEEQFEMLRDFGFGTPTGAEFPGESRGILTMPHRWAPNFTRASVAMGYEFAVTPVQLAAAYGSIATGGVLMAPTLVREIRDPAGRVLYQHHPEPVRRVITSEVAGQLREFLREAASEGGTGERAQLTNYAVLGKTGTAVKWVNGHYDHSQFNASFAAIFPADHPQLVVIVKIDNPRGQYYGGLTAAPVTRTMLQQALASHRVANDRGRLASRDTTTAPGAARAAETRAEAPAPVLAPVVVTLPYRAAKPDPNPRPVPDVAGRSIREAALALHRRGFRVDLRGLGRVVGTQPAAGQSAAPGSSVVVMAQ